MDNQLNLTEFPSTESQPETIVLPMAQQWASVEEFATAARATCEAVPGAAR